MNGQRDMTRQSHRERAKEHGRETMTERDGEGHGHTPEKEIRSQRKKETQVDRKKERLSNRERLRHGRKKEK